MRLWSYALPSRRFLICQRLPSVGQEQHCLAGRLTDRRLGQTGAAGARSRLSAVNALGVAADDVDNVGLRYRKGHPYPDTASPASCSAICRATIAPVRALRPIDTGQAGGAPPLQVSRRRPPAHRRCRHRVTASVCAFGCAWAGAGCARPISRVAGLFGFTRATETSGSKAGSRSRRRRSSGTRSDLANAGSALGQQVGGNYKLGSCAGVSSEDEESLGEGATDVGGCQFLGRMVIKRHDVARTGSVLLPPGSVTRQQFSPRCSARPRRIWSSSWEYSPCAIGRRNTA